MLKKKWEHLPTPSTSVGSKVNFALQRKRWITRLLANCHKFAASEELADKK